MYTPVNIKVGFKGVGGKTIYACFLFVFIINRIIAEHQRDASFYIYNMRYTQNILMFKTNVSKHSSL